MAMEDGMHLGAWNNW